MAERSKAETPGSGVSDSGPVGRDCAVGRRSWRIGGSEEIWERRKLYCRIRRHGQGPGGRDEAERLRSSLKDVVYRLVCGSEEEAKGASHQVVMKGGEESPIDKGSQKLVEVIRTHTRRTRMQPRSLLSSCDGSKARNAEECSGGASFLPQRIRSEAVCQTGSSDHLIRCLSEAPLKSRHKVQLAERNAAGKAAELDDASCHSTLARSSSSCPSLPSIGHISHKKKKRKRRKKRKSLCGSRSHCPQIEGHFSPPQRRRWFLQNVESLRPVFECDGELDEQSSDSDGIIGKYIATAGSVETDKWRSPLVDKTEQCGDYLDSASSQLRDFSIQHIISSYGKKNSSGEEQVLDSRADNLRVQLKDHLQHSISMIYR